MSLSGGHSSLSIISTSDEDDDGGCLMLSQRFDARNISSETYISGSSSTSEYGILVFPALRG